MKTKSSGVVGVLKQSTQMTQSLGGISRCAQYSRARGDGFDDLFWQLCYSHYLYPAFLTAKSYNIIENLNNKPTNIQLLSKRTGLSVDSMLALLPTLILFQAAKQLKNGAIVARSSRSPITSADWEPMFRRHIENDEHVEKQMKLFSQSGSQTSRDFWRAQLTHQVPKRIFLDSIDAHSRGTAPLIAKELCSARIRTLVDVGAGLGTNSFAALRHSRLLRVLMIDQPLVVHVTTALQEFKRFENRAEVVPLDALTDPWPRNDGVFLLAHFLQDFGLVDRSRLLNQARASMLPGAELWIHGHFWQGQMASSTVAAFSFYLHCHVGGALLSIEQQILECRNAGFRIVRYLQTSATQYLLIFAKDSSKL